MDIIKRIIGSLFFVVYNIVVALFILIGWVLAVILKTRSFTIKNYLKRVFPNPKQLSNTILFHFSSLGEMNGAKPLIDYFINNKKDVVITVFTETSYNEAKQRYENIYLFPFDFYFIMKRFINRINPSMVFITETEIWPTFIKISSKKAKLFWINGRISQRSFKRYRLIKPFLRYILSDVERVFVQYQEDKRHFSYFIDEKKIEVVGNTKFDITPLVKDDEIMEKIRLWRKDSFCVVFGSIHPDEFPFIVSSYKLLKAEGIAVRYLVVPRHIEKIDEFIGVLEKDGLRYLKLSDIISKDADADILLFDKLGYLAGLYNLSDISFVGGTLNDVGGHNLLEPAYYKKPVLFGSHYSNQYIAGKKLIENIGGFIINDVYELKARIKFFYFDKEKLAQAGENSYKTLKELSGATQRIISELSKEKT